MGGFTLPGTADQLETNAWANRDLINCMDHFLEILPPIFLTLNPHIRDVTSKPVQVIEILWKYQCKLPYLEKAVIRNTDSLRWILNRAEEDYVKLSNPRLLFTEKRLILEIQYFQRFFSNVQRLKKEFGPAIAQLRASALRCSRMAQRVKHELNQLSRPEQRLLSKRILHPEMHVSDIRFFVNECRKIAQASQKRVATYSLIQDRLRSFARSSFIILNDYNKEMGRDRRQTVRIIHRRQWDWIEIYEQTSLKNFGYCAYSCAYRPLSANFYCSLYLSPDVPHIGHDWMMTNLFRDFYFVVFKLLTLKLFPPRKPWSSFTKGNIDSFHLSNTVIKAGFSIYLYGIQPNQKFGCGKLYPACRTPVAMCTDNPQHLETTLKNGSKMEKGRIRTIRVSNFDGAVKLL